MHENGVSEKLDKGDKTMSQFTEQAEWTIAKELTEKAGKGESVSNELNAIPKDERIAIARKMERYSELRNDLPDLTITVESNMLTGQDHLTNVSVNNGYMFDSDVFDMAKEGMGKFAEDIARDSRIQEAYLHQPLEGLNPSVSQQLERWHDVQKELGKSVGQKTGI